MTNLLHLVVSLVDDPEARERFRNDPEGALVDLDDLTGEDVAAVADVARVQVDPGHADVIVTALDPRVRGDESPRDVAIRSLVAICDAAEAASHTTVDP